MGLHLNMMSSKLPSCYIYFLPSLLPNNLLQQPCLCILHQPYNLLPLKENRLPQNPHILLDCLLRTTSRQRLLPQLHSTEEVLTQQYSQRSSHQPPSPPPAH